MIFLPYRPNGIYIIISRIDGGIMSDPPVLQVASARDVTYNINRSDQSCIKIDSLVH